MILDDPFLLKYIISEIEFMKTIKGKNIIGLKEYHEDEDAYYLIMELADRNLR